MPSWSVGDYLGRQTDKHYGGSVGSSMVRCHRKAWLEHVTWWKRKGSQVKERQWVRVSELPKQIKPHVTMAQTAQQFIFSQ